MKYTNPQTEIYIEKAWKDFESKDPYEQCKIIANIVGWDRIAMVLGSAFANEITNLYLDMEG